jgi:chorismate synthase
MSHFGQLLRLSTYGESHSLAVGGILEGFPSCCTIDQDKLQQQVNRRRARGQLSTARQEEDKIVFLSGLQDSVTLGTPLGFLVYNRDIKPSDYKGCQQSGEKYIPRPSHADFTYLKKYGIHAKSGGGRSSARETIPRVIAGAFAEQYLEQQCGTSIVGWVSQVGCVKLDLSRREQLALTRSIVDKSEIRCPRETESREMIKLIQDAKSEGDSVGGVVSCIIKNPALGIGEPCFDKLEAKLAQAMLSIPATKGFEIGEGFSVAEMKGSSHNDCFTQKDGVVKPESNRAGGILGGISSGEAIYFRVPIKPPSSIEKSQQTCDLSGENVDFSTVGRHDPCVVQRAVAIVEAMAALCLADLFLLQKRNSIQ